ncbi:hypothetical protein [Streptomyces finlayi]|nr:hypothetical protein [Streptomyces finlayi]
MDVTELLRAASLLAPEETAGENDLTVDDVWDHLVHDEWDVALGLLEELGGGHSLPPDFWEELAGAAEKLRFERSAAWCHWRSYESRHGMVRADLTLRPTGEYRRRTPFSGAGALRPMWDIGNLAPGGGPILDIASLWVESAPSLGPGERATVRLAPLAPARWRHLRRGQTITMYEGGPVAGTAVVLEVRAPQNTA